MTKENALSSIAMLVPTASFVDMSLGFYSSIISSFDRVKWDATILSIYALFLCAYLLYVFFVEYWRYHRLHNLKSPIVDIILVGMVFVSIRELLRRSGEVHEAFAALACFLLALVIWEIVTMQKGYRHYFNANKKSLTLRKLLSLLLGVIKFKVQPHETTHWDEYRYWLISDIIFLLLIVAGWMVSLLGGLPDVVSRITICTVGFYVGILNTWRYRMAERHWRES